MDEPSETTVRAWARLVKASHAVLSAVEADLKAAGFPPLAWYDLLLELERVGGEGLRPFELERRTLLAQYNLSRLVERLAQAGYLERRPCPEDGRGSILVLTRAGRALLRRMWPAYRAAIEDHVGRRLSEREAEQLGRLLGKLVGQA